MNARAFVLSVAVLIGVVNVSGAASARVASAAPQHSCPGNLGAKTPVLLVHGYNDDANRWKNSYRRFCDARTWATTFNYGDRSARYGDPSLQWVKDARIGPALAQTISDLAAQSAQGNGPGKVVVIAHSMGGLALRCALVDACAHHGDLRTKVGAAVTFDTPNTGSFLRGNGSIAESALVTAATWMVSGGCFAAELRAGVAGALLEFATQFCRHLTGVLTGPAAQAFTRGSTQLNTLPELAGDFPLTAVAGRIALKTTLFYHDVTLGHVGDLVVGEDSAFAAARGRPGAEQVTVDCGAFNLVIVDLLMGGVPQIGLRSEVPRCWHAPEPATTEFLTAARRAVDAYTDSTLVKPVTLADLLSAPVPALRGNPAQNMVNGKIPRPYLGGGVELVTTGGGAPAYGDLNGDGVPDAAAAVSATSGAGGDEDYVQLYTDGHHRLGQFDPGGASQRQHGIILAMIIRNGEVLIDWIAFDGAGYRITFGSAHLRWDGSRVVASQLLDRTGATGSGFLSDPALQLRPDGLGAVKIGMSYDAAAAAAGTTFQAVGDGVSYAENLPKGSYAIHVSGGYIDGSGVSHGEVQCIGIDGSPVHAQQVTTPEGFQLGQTVNQLKRLYGSRLTYVPNPYAGGLAPENGYVLKAGTGELVFAYSDLTPGIDRQEPPGSQPITKMFAAKDGENPSSCPG